MCTHSQKICVWTRQDHSKFLKKFQFFWLHPPVFALEKQPKNLNFQSLFTSKRPFRGYYQRNRCTYFQKICTLKGMVLPNWPKTFETFWSHFSVFAIQKQLKNLNFQRLFTHKKTFGAYFQRGGYFQRNACSYFQEICSWTRNSNAKLMKNIHTFWLHSSIFALEKQPKQLSFHDFFKPHALNFRKYIVE